MSKTVRLNKIPITTLLQILSQLFEEGADYIDIEGKPEKDSESDVLKVTVRPEYYSKDLDIEEIKIEQFNKQLSDEDINDLI